jgi:hypothetical protein
VLFPNINVISVNTTNNTTTNVNTNNNRRDLVAAVRSGDLGKYNKCLTTFLDVFVKQGTYLVLEKVKEGGALVCLFFD